MIDSVDEDQNGIIDFTEFLALMSSNMKEPEKKDEYAEAFKVFDRDNSSQCSGTELVAAIRQLNSKHIEAVEKVLTDNFDADG